MCCATSSTPSIAATRSSHRGCASCCAGPSVSADDDRALRATTLRHYHGRAERRLDALIAMPAAHPAGRELQSAVKAWRTKFFVFLEDPDVPATNNACEREIRPSVVFRKVTGGFRSDWGAHIHAGYRSVTGTARLHGRTALQAIDQLLAGTFTPTPVT